MVNIYRIIFVLVTVAAYSFSEDLQFSVTADRTSASIGEQIMITAQAVSAKKLNSIVAPKLAKSEEFDVVGTNQNQSSSTSIQVINGKMTQNVTVTYLFYYSISPKKTGSFTFPALQLVADGNTYNSNSFVINVGKEAPQAVSEVKVSVSINKKNLYVGEQAILTVQVAQKAGAQVQMTQQGLADHYDKIEKELGRDFSVARLFSQLPSKGATQAIGGENFFVVKVNYAVFPINAGTSTIQGVPFEYISLKRVQQSRRRGGDPFFDEFFNDNFFGGGGVEQTQRSAVSNSLSVHITQLPPGAPAGFSGAVGNFRLSSGIDPKEVPAGEAVTLTLSINGNTRPGNIGDVTLPQLTESSVFTPEKHISIDTTANGIVSHKTYKYLIIPKQEGKLGIPPVYWAYFDPAEQAYKTLKTDTINVSVTKGNGAPAVQSRYLTQEEIRQVGQDIRYIKTGIKIKRQADEPYKNPVLILLYMLPFLAAISALLYKIQSRRYRMDATLSLRRKAFRCAMKKTAVIEKKAKTIKADDFLGKISECIETYITHKFGFPATGKVLVELKQELLEHGVNEDAASRLASFIESMDNYRFGGTVLNEASRLAMLHKTKEFIRELEHTKKDAGK
jgi:hypothetical protein